MPTLFFSYRRADAQADARQLREGLRQQLPQYRIVREAGNASTDGHLEPAIRTAIEACDAVLLLLSPGWAGPGADGRRSIDEAQDRMRLELRTALALKKRVIPVLLNGTPMPRADELPAELGALARINGIPLQARSWDADLLELSRWLHRLVRTHQGPRPEAAAATAAAAEPVSSTMGYRRRRAAAHSGLATTGRRLLIALGVGAGVLLVAYGLLLLVNLFDEAPLPALALPPAAAEPAAPADGNRLLGALRDLGAPQLPLLAGCMRQDVWACPGSGSDEALAAWRGNAALQQNWRALYAARGFSFTPAVAQSRSVPYDDGAMSGYVRAGALSLAEIGRAFQQGRRDAAWAALVAELHLRRRVSAAGRDFVVRGLALRSWQAALRLADQALSDAVPPSAQARQLAAVLAPLHAAERDLSQALAHELQVLTVEARAAQVAMRSLDTRFAQGVLAYYESLGIPEQAPALLPFDRPLFNLLAAPTFKPQATINQLQALFEQDTAQLALPPQVYVDPAARRDYARRRAPISASHEGFAALYNPAGKHVLKALERKNDTEHTRAAVPVAEDDYFELHDTDALLRLLSLKLQLRLAGTRRADVPALLQKDPRLFDPYTAQPMAWDAGLAEIRAGLRGRRSGLPAAVRVGDFVR